MNCRAIRKALILTTVLMAVVALCSDFVVVGNKLVRNGSSGLIVPWTPERINPSIWLDAAEPDAITELAGGVSSWLGKGSVGVDVVQGSGSQQPLYQTNQLNGLPTVTWDGINDFLRGNSAMATTLDIGIYEVKRWKSVDASNRRAFCLERSTFTQGEIFQYASNIESGAGVRYPVTIPPAEWVKLSSPPVGTFQIISYRRPSTTLQTIRLDGAYAGTNTETTVTFAPQRITWGAQSGSGFYGNIESAELIVVLGPSDEDTEKIEGYLAWKWGLTGNLPAGHPYKEVRP